MEAIYTYDAVKVYAMALHEILSGNGDICNGSHVVRTIIDMRTYPSDIQGINVTIDENGDSEGTSMLLAMVKDDNCVTKFEKIGDFYEDNRSEIPVSFLNFKRPVVKVGPLSIIGLTASITDIKVLSMPLFRYWFLTTPNVSCGEERTRQTITFHLEESPLVALTMSTASCPWNLCLEFCFWSCCSSYSFILDSGIIST